MLFRLVSFTGTSRTVRPGTSICTPAARGPFGNGGSGCLSGTGGMGGSAAKAQVAKRSAARAFMAGSNGKWKREDGKGFPTRADSYADQRQLGHQCQIS